MWKHAKQNEEEKVKQTSYNTTQIPFRQKQHTSFTV